MPVTQLKLVARKKQETKPVEGTKEPPQTPDDEISLRKADLAKLLKQNPLAVETVAHNATTFAANELSFDGELWPALEFLECMSVTPGGLFQLVISADLPPLLVNAFTNSGNHEEIQKVLKSMEEHAGSPKFATLILDALNRLETNNNKAAMERLIRCPNFLPSFKRLKVKVRQVLAKCASEYSLLPGHLQRCVWEADFELAKPMVNQELYKIVKKLRRSMLAHDSYRAVFEDVKPLFPQFGTALKLVLKHTKNIHREAANYKTVALRDIPPEDPYDQSDPQGRGQPISHGPEPFLSTVRRSILMVAIQTQQLTQSVIGSWELSAESNGRSLASYKITFAAGPGGTIVGSSELPGVTKVTGRVAGESFSFLQERDSMAFYCECTLVGGQLTKGQWRTEGGTAKGTFSAVRAGRVVWADHHSVEWDPLTDLMVQIGKLDLDGVRMSLQHLFAGKGGREAFKMEAEVCSSLADPFVLQLLVDRLIRQCVTRTPADSALTKEAGFLLVMLHAAAQNGCARDGGQTLLSNQNWDTSSLKALGLRAVELAEALRCFAHPEMKLEDINFHQKMDALRIGALQVQKTHEDRPLNTLRLLVTVLASKAVQNEQSTHLKECLAVACELRQISQQSKKCIENKMVDWIDQLLSDWLLNAMRAHQNWPQVPSAIRKPALDYLTSIAMEDPSVHYQVCSFMSKAFEPFACYSEETKLISKKLWVARCFGNALYDWSKDIACVFAPVLKKKRYLHEGYKACGLEILCTIPPDEDGHDYFGTYEEELLRRTPPRPPKPVPPVIISDEPEKLILHRERLEAPDSVLGLRVAQTVHEYCKNVMAYSGISMQEAASKAIEMLHNSYQGTAWIANLVTQWITRLQGQDNDRTCLRNCIAKRMLTHFDAARADRLTNRSQPCPSVPWVESFIKVKEWKNVIYELSNESRGRSSRFVTGLLAQIAEMGNFEEVMKLNSTSESFQLFIRKMRELILRVLKVADVDETLVKDDLDAFCDAACHKQYTYIYSQGILRELISSCTGKPVMRPLQYLSEALTDHNTRGGVAGVRVELRLSPVGQSPELSEQLHSMCRSGAPVITGTEAQALCLHLEKLLFGAQAVQGHGTKRGLLVGENIERQPKRLKRVPSEASRKRRPPESEDTERKKTRTADSDSSAPTEVATEASSWGHGSIGSGQAPVQAMERTEEVSVSDGSLLWPAHSAVSVPETTGRADDRDPTKGVRGILETLRSKVFFEELLTRFVDPSANLKLTATQRRSYARLMALCCHDGLLADENSASRQTALKAVEDSTKELEAIHGCVHDPLQSWLQKLAVVARLQTTALGCAGGLRWLQRVVLSDRLSSQQLLQRAAQPVIYSMLKSAWNAHPKKPVAGRILRILRQILEHLTASTARVEVKECDSPIAESRPRGIVTVEPGDLAKAICKLMAAALLFLANAAQVHVQVIELVRDTVQSWEAESMKFFIDELLASSAQPYSRRFCRSMLLLLAVDRVRGLCHHPQFILEARSSLDLEMGALATVELRRQEAAQAYALLTGGKGLAVAVQGHWKHSSAKISSVSVQGLKVNLGNTQETLTERNGELWCGKWRCDSVIQQRVVWRSGSRTCAWTRS